MPPDPTTLEFLQRCGVRNLAPDRLAVLERFHTDLNAANERTNLTRITSSEEFWVKHVADSLALGLAAPEVLQAAWRVADVGSGAGFPLVPLAWANPELRLTAVEARPRKAEFLQEETARLGLTGCEVVGRQAREAGRLPGLAAAHDLVVARAVGGDEHFVRDCRGLLKPEPGARLVLYKTPESITSERAVLEREAAKFGFVLSTSPVLELPLGMGTRQFAFFSRSAC